MPKDLTIEYKKYEVREQIYNQRIKMYVTKEMNMVNNIDSIYAKIWGQCADPPQKMIKHINEFALKHKEK